MAPHDKPQRASQCSKASHSKDDGRGHSSLWLCRVPVAEGVTFLKAPDCQMLACASMTACNQSRQAASDTRSENVFQGSIDQSQHRRGCTSVDLPILGDTELFPPADARCMPL